MRVALLASAACLCVTAACAQAPTDSSDDALLAPAPSVLAALSPREGVNYPVSGVYAVDETPVAVGVLRYLATSDTEGSWVLASREDTAVLAADVKPFAVLTGQPGFDSELWPLDGQYVAAEGLLTEQDTSTVQVEVTGLSLVADIFPSDTNSYSRAGVYTLPDGSTFVLGWAGDTMDGTTDLYDIDPDGPGTPALIAQVTPSGKGPPRGQVMHAGGFVVRDEPVPLVRAPLGGGYGPGPIRTIEIGRQAGWRHVERAGVKDIPDGRRRVVGILMSDDASDPTSDPYRVTVGEPRTSYPTVSAWEVRLDDPNGLVDMKGVYVGAYVAAEGTLSVDGHRMMVDAFELIPSP